MKMNFQYHVTCGKEKKIFSCNEGCCRSDFIQDLGLLFDVEVNVVQVFDVQWGDWVNHSEAIIPPNGSRLNLIFNEPAQKIIMTNSTSALVEEPVKSVQLLDHCNSSSTNIFGSTSGRIPDPYVVPALPPVIIDLINKKDAVVFKTKYRSVIIQNLYEDVSKFALYPNGFDYARVCLALVNKHKFLKDRLENSTGYDSWIVSLRMKFRHERMQMGNLDVVKIMKEKYKNKRPKSDSVNIVTEEPKKKLDRSSNLDKYGLGEDIETVKAHISIIQRESKKSQLDETLLEGEMRKTLTYRQHTAFKNEVADVIVEFPLLCQKNQLVFELNRLKNIAPSAEKIIEHHFQPISSKIISMINSQTDKKKRKKVERFLTNIAEKKEVLTDEKVKDLEVRTSMIILPSLFGENIDLWVSETAPKSSTPTLVFQNEDFLSAYMEVVIENVSFEVSSLAFGIASIFSGYYTFQLKYATGLSKTMEYLQKVVFGIDAKRFSVSVASVHNMLQD